MPTPRRLAPGTSSLSPPGGLVPPFCALLPYKPSGVNNRPVRYELGQMGGDRGSPARKNTATGAETGRLASSRAPLRRSIICEFDYESFTESWLPAERIPVCAPRPWAEYPDHDDGTTPR